MKYILALTILIGGCAVTAERQEDRLTLRGWGAKSAKWGADGSAEISKEEPIRTPDLLPITR